MKRYVYGKTVTFCALIEVAKEPPSQVSLPGATILKTALKIGNHRLMEVLLATL